MNLLKLSIVALGLAFSSMSYAGDANMRAANGGKAACNGHDTRNLGSTVSFQAQPEQLQKKRTRAQQRVSEAFSGN